MFEDNVLERRELVLEDVESPQSIPASHEPGIQSHKQNLTARGPFPAAKPGCETASFTGSTASNSAAGIRQ
jgi:hypothetical protein